MEICVLANKYNRDRFQESFLTCCQYLPFVPRCLSSRYKPRRFRHEVELENIPNCRDEALLL